MPHDPICSKGITEHSVLVWEIQGSDTFLCSSFNFGNSLLAQSLTKAADSLRPCLYTVPSLGFHAHHGVILSRISFSQQSLDTHCLTQKRVSGRGEMTFPPTHACKISVVGFATSPSCSPASPTLCHGEPVLKQVDREALYSAVLHFLHRWLSRSSRSLSPLTEQQPVFSTHLKDGRNTRQPWGTGKQQGGLSPDQHFTWQQVWVSLMWTLQIQRWSS